MCCDCMTPRQRRHAMQSNRGRTRPERELARRLWRLGLRYWTADGYRRRMGRRFFGSPDLIFTTRQVVVFVDGCFWHGCRRCHDFDHDLNVEWQAKILTNVERDKKVRRRLRRDGWRVLVVREHQLRRKDGFERVTERLVRSITTNG